MGEPNESKSARGRKPYPPEMRERSVRLMLEHQGDYPTRMAAIRSVATKMGVHWTTLHEWVKRAETDPSSARLSADDAEELKRLRRENKELRRANEILKSASVFFATELDGRQPR
jgi:transposase